MDGAAKQKEMTEHIKSLTKDGADARRKKDAASKTAFIVTSQADYPGQATFHRPGQGPDNSGASSETAAADSINPTEPTPDPYHPDNWIASLGKAWELDFTMMYMDYAFPFLFPFYRPPLVGTGRSWLLSFVRQSRTILHSVLSMSAFFFTFGLREIFPEREMSCRSVMWNQVEEQASMSFEMLQEDLVNMTGTGKQPDVLTKARIMETIVHLLVFDLFIGRSDNWEAHLTPATTLLEDILRQHPPSSPGETRLGGVLEQMNWPRPRFPGFDRQLWNPDQAAFRFFTSILIFIDIIATTSLQRAPKLASYHSQILGDVPSDEIDCPLDLFPFIGCQNWAILAIGDIAALDAWKKNTQLTGILNATQLAAQADRIFQSLKEKIEALDTIETPSDNADSERSRHLQPFYSSDNHDTSKPSSLTPTRIWAHAAQIYLRTVSPASDTSGVPIQHHVTQICRLVKQIEAVAQIRTLAWPICVAGCLALGLEQQQEFRNIVNSSGENMHLRSALREAGRIMEEVWVCRVSSGVDEHWDIGAYLNSLGAPALLI